MIVCPVCGCRHCPVTKTIEHSYTHRSIKYLTNRRYRKCRYCKKIFVTEERYRDHPQDEENEEGV